MKLKNIESWSISKSNLYQKCPRSLYFRAKSTSNEKEVFPIGTVIGGSVHFGISIIIDNWHNGEKIKISRIHDEVKSKLEYLFENKENKIIEAINGFDISDDLLPKFSSLAIKNIDFFYRMVWPNINRHEYLTHEKLDYFDLKNIKVWVKLDLLTQFSEKYYITDWKTDRKDRYYKYKKQLFIYAIYVKNKFDLQFNDVLLQIINLSKGSYHKIPFDLNSIKSIKDLIIEDVNEWKSFKSKKNFETKPTYNKCKSCLCLNKCDDGKEILKNC